MPSFFLETFGCTFNKADSASIAAALCGAGFKRLSSPSRASLFVLNSCSVKGATQEKILARLRKLSAAKKKILVLGCLAQTDPDSILSVSRKIGVLGTYSSSRVAEAAKAVLSGKPFFDYRAFQSGILPPAAAVEGAVARIQLCRGCVGSCAYCSTKIARGQLSSFSPEEINSLFRESLRLGAKEIHLTAQDAGCYGLDLGTSLPKLLFKLLENKGEYRIRLGMMNPEHFLSIHKNLLRAMDDERVFKFFHLPVQSASGKVLLSMNRRYSPSDFRKCVALVRGRFPKASISTDVIVGYPGETEEDFMRTINLLKDAGFDTVNVSRYSPRPGTPAALLPQISSNDQKFRSRFATSVWREKSLEKNRALLGSIQTVLVDKELKRGVEGRTDEYKPVVLRRKIRLGSFAKCKIIDFDETVLFGAVTGRTSGRNSIHSNL